MATVGIKRFELTKFGEAEAGNVYAYPEAAAQSYKKGDPVALTGGKVRLGVDTESGIWGLAWEDASGVTDTFRLVLVFTPAMVFSGNISAAGAATATLVTDRGLACSWIKSTVTGETTKTVVDRSDVTTPDLEIIDLDPRDALGDTNGRVLFRVIAARIVASPV